MCSLRGTGGHRGSDLVANCCRILLILRVWSCVRIIKICELKLHHLYITLLLERPKWTNKHNEMSCSWDWSTCDIIQNLPSELILFITCSCCSIWTESTFTDAGHHRPTLLNPVKAHTHTHTCRACDAAGECVLLLRNSLSQQEFSWLSFCSLHWGGRLGLSFCTDRLFRLKQFHWLKMMEAAN